MFLLLFLLRYFESCSDDDSDMEDHPDPQVSQTANGDVEHLHQ